MSHYVVAVFTNTDDSDELDDLMDHYCECTENTEYLEFCPCPESMEDFRAKYEEQKEHFKNFEEFVEQWYGYHYNEAEDAWGYICNPNAKWDWWQTGGRWGSMLRLKDGGTADFAKVSDIDLSLDQEEYNRALRFWEVVVEGQEILPHENKDSFFNFYKPKYYIDYYGTKAKYAESCASFSTYAFLTEEGEWIAKGDMGMFGIGTDNGESHRAYIKKLNDYMKEHPDLYLTIVDCHI